MFSVRKKPPDIFWYLATVFPTLYDAFIPLKLDKKVFSDLNQKIDNAKREFGIICKKIDQAIWANMKFRHKWTKKNHHKNMQFVHSKDSLLFTINNDKHDKLDEN